MNAQVLLDQLVLASPMVLIGLGAFVVLIVDMLSRGRGATGVSIASSGFLLLGLVASIVPLIEANAPQLILNDCIRLDGVTYLSWSLFLFAALMSHLPFCSSLEKHGVDEPGEYSALFMFSAFGGMVFVSAADFLTLFLGLEMMSIPLYALCGCAVFRKRSTESALKYFLLGSFGSAILLYGIALIFGVAHGFGFDQVRDMSSAGSSLVFLFGMGLTLIGLLFKVGIVPIHFWVPDVYDGAPTPVTTYMASAIKVVAVLAAFRICWFCFGHSVVFWSSVVWWLSAITMTYGNLAALRQKSVKRMLAYSSIAHAGYMLSAFLGRSQDFGGAPALMYYLASYVVMTVGAFLVVAHVAAIASRQGELEIENFSAFSGLGWKKPWLGLLMAIFMFSLAGLPPGVAGLVAKVYLFGSVMKADYMGLVVVAVLNSAISCYYYLKVVVVMYFQVAKDVGSTPKPDDFGEEPSEGTPILFLAVVNLCAFGVVAVGLFPSWLYDLASAACSGIGL